jgi:hypothetical protein
MRRLRTEEGFFDLTYEATVGERDRGCNIPLNIVQSIEFRRKPVLSARMSQYRGDGFSRPCLDQTLFNAGNRSLLPMVRLPLPVIIEFYRFRLLLMGSEWRESISKVNISYGAYSPAPPACCDVSGEVAQIDTTSHQSHTSHISHSPTCHSSLASRGTVIIQGLTSCRVASPLTLR